MGILDDLKRLEIRNERLHRLRLLELAQARKGIDTPPDIIIEIETTRAELGISELLLAEKASKEFAEEIGAEGQFLVLTRLIKEVAGQIETQGRLTSERIETQGRSIEERIDRVEEHQEAVNTRQDNERKAGQRRTRLAMFAIAVALIVLAGGVIYIVITLRTSGL